MLDSAPLIGGQVWHDLDRDGYGDATEPPLANVRIALYDIGPNRIAGDHDDFFVDETTSGSDGHYAFVDVPAPSTYELRFTPPDGYYVGHVYSSYTQDGRSSVVGPSTGTISYQTVRVGDVETRLSAGFETPPEFGDLTTLRSVGSSNNNVGSSIARDRDGNLYVVGTLDGTIDFDPSLATQAQTSGGRRYAFIASYTAESDLRWARSLGGTTALSSAQARAVAALPDGGVAIAGDFRGSVDFDPGEVIDLRTSQGDMDAFVAKFDSSGDFVWAQAAGGSGTEVVGGLAVGASGNIVVGGGFTASVDFDPDPSRQSILSSAGGQDAFLWNLDSSGDLVWAKPYRGTGTEMVNALAIAPDGGVVSTGIYGSSTDFNPGVGFASLNHAGGTDAFLAKLDSAGNYLFAKAISASSSEAGRDVAVDLQGNIYVTGSFDDTTDFDPGPGTYNLESDGTDKLFALKLDSAGVFVWARGLSGRWATVGEMIAVDANQNVSIGGSYTQYFEPGLDFDPGPDEFLLRPSSQYASLEWRLTPSGELAWGRFVGNALRDLATDDEGNVFSLMALSRYSDVDPGPGKYHALEQNANDIVVVKYFPPGEISGVAWNDLNGNGMRDDGEPPVGGVELRLYDSIDGTIGDDNDGQFWPTVISGADGSFRFRSVLPGPLYLKPDATLGRRPTLADQGLDETRDNDLVPGINRTEVIDLGSNELVDDVGLGFVTFQPVPNDDAYSTAEDTLLHVAAGGLLGNDDHSASAAATVSLVKPPIHGSITLHGDGGFDYVPDADYFGTDRFSYLLSQNDDAGLAFVREHRRYARDTGFTRDLLGRSVATTGDYAVAGAPGDRNSSSAYGSAYIYRWTGEAWAEHAKLIGLRENESFGMALDMSADVLAITSQAINSEVGGRLFIYRRTGQDWRSEATLSPSDPAPGSGWGRAVSMHGDTIAVSANGAVYVFRRSGSRWSQHAKIVLPTPNSVGVNVNSIAVYGDTLAIGNWGHSEHGPNSGAVYIYERMGGSWTLQSTLTAADATERDEFGRSVALDGNTLAVGATQTDENTDSPGAVYVFERSGGDWTQTARLKGDTRTNYGFGSSLDLVGDVLAVGNPSEQSVGAAYIFQRNDGTWPRQARLVAADPEMSSYLGRAVAIGPHSVVSSGIHDFSLDDGKGAVYFFDFLRGAVATVTIDVVAAPDAPRPQSDVYPVLPGATLSALVRGGTPPSQFDAYVMTLANWFRLPQGGTSPDARLFVDYLYNDDRSIAVDPVDGKVYWTDALSNTIKRSEPTGENVETIVAQAGNPRGLTIDPVARRMYWTNHDVYGISRANLDGTGVVRFDPREGIGGSPGLALDATAGHLYYTSSDSIRRVNVDGTGAIDLISSGINSSYGIALDLFEQKMYWAEVNGRRIRRANLDGTDMETILTTGPTSPYGVAIDPDNRKLYWTEQGSTNATQRVMRANLDGSEVEVLMIEAFNDPASIALMPTSSYATATLIPAGAMWRFLDDGSSPSAAWRFPPYNDANWKLGYAELGFGDESEGRPEATRINPGPNGNQHAAYYFRRQISIADVSQFSHVRLDLKFDDGAVVYFNGTEVMRSNMPQGTITSSTMALNAAANDGADFTSFVLPTTALRDGVNVIAVSVHQSSRTSSDLSFDLKLTGVPRAAPVYGVLENDFDPDSSLTATLIAGPYRGTLSFQPNGTFVYTPDAGFEGVDQFIYRASDETAGSQPSLVTINVGEANEPPSAADDRYVVRNNRTSSVSVASGLLLNDVDFNGDELSAALLAPPVQGSLSLAADGSFAYTPNSGFVGVDTFTYRLSDGSGAFAVATATLHVVPQRDPINGIPFASDDAFEATAGVLSIAAPGVLANDADPEQRTIFAIVEQAPWHGSLSFAADGSFTYTPLPGFSGADTFTYRAADGNTFSMPATVTLNVLAPNPSSPLSDVAVSVPRATSFTISPIPRSMIGSSTTSLGTTSTLPSFADLNDDDRVDRGDLSVVVAAYGSTNLAADLNADGRVSLADAIVMRNAMASQSFEPGAIVQSSATQLTPRAVDQALLYATRRFIRRSPAVNADVLGDLMASGSRDPSSLDSNCVRLNPARRPIRDRR